MQPTREQVRRVCERIAKEVGGSVTHHLSNRDTMATGIAGFTTNRRYERHRFFAKVDGQRIEVCLVCGKQIKRSHIAGNALAQTKHLSVHADVLARTPGGSYELLRSTGREP